MNKIEPLDGNRSFSNYGSPTKVGPYSGTRNDLRDPSPLQKRLIKANGPSEPEFNSPSKNPLTKFTKNSVTTALPQVKDQKQSTLHTFRPQENQQQKVQFDSLKCKEHQSQIIGVCLQDGCAQRLHCHASAFKHKHELEHVENVFNASLIDRKEREFLAGLDSQFLYNELAPVLKDIDKIFQRTVAVIETIKMRIKEEIKKICLDFFESEAVTRAQSIKSDLQKTLSQLEQNLPVDEDTLLRYTYHFRLLTELAQNPARYRTTNVAKVNQQVQKLETYAKSVESALFNQITQLFSPAELTKPYELPQEFHENLFQLQKDLIPLHNAQESSPLRRTSRPIKGILKNNDQRSLSPPSKVDTYFPSRKNTLPEIARNMDKEDSFIIPLNRKPKPTLEAMLTKPDSFMKNNLAPLKLNAEALKQVREIELKSQEPIVSLAYSAAADKLISASISSIRAYECQNFQMIELVKFARKNANVQIKCFPTKELFVRVFDAMMELRAMDGDFTCLAQWDLKYAIKDFDIAEESNMIGVSTHSGPVFLVDYEEKTPIETSESGQLIANLGIEPCFVLSDDLDLKVLSKKTFQLVGIVKNAHTNLSNKLSYGILSLQYDSSRKMLYTCTADKIKIWQYNTSNCSLGQVMVVNCESLGVTALISNCLDDKLIVMDEKKDLVVINATNSSVMKTYKLSENRVMFSSRDRPLLINLFSKGQILAGLGMGNKFVLFQT